MSRRAKISGGIAFLQRTRNAIQGGFMNRPGWFDAVVQYQPGEPPKAERKNVEPITYPEDRLLDVLAKKHPELWSNTIVNLVPDDQGHVNYTHPATVFVERQKHWIAQGKSEEEAYELVLEDWKRQRRFERIELQAAMLQAEEHGVELQATTPWQERYEESFQEAMTRRLNLEQQKRRERLEELLEARDAEGETDVIELASLDPDVSQADLNALLENDERAQEHFGGDGSVFSVEIERLLPRQGDADFEPFRDFVERNMSEEMRQLVASTTESAMDPSRAQYFRQLDDAMEQHRQQQMEEMLEQAPAKEADAPVMGGKLKKKPNTKAARGGKAAKGKTTKKKH